MCLVSFSKLSNLHTQKLCVNLFNTRYLAQCLLETISVHCYSQLPTNMLVSLNMFLTLENKLFTSKYLRTRQQFAAVPEANRCLPSFVSLPSAPSVNLQNISLLLCFVISFHDFIHICLQLNSLTKIKLAMGRRADKNTSSMLAIYIHPWEFMKPLFTFLHIAPSGAENSVCIFNKKWYYWKLTH